jgi:hypothetical protein
MHLTLAIEDTSRERHNLFQNHVNRLACLAEQLCICLDYVLRHLYAAKAERGRSYDSDHSGAIRQAICEVE